MASYVKGPNETLDYTVDWSDSLTTVSDTISTSTWTVEDGLTLTSNSNTSTTATAWLSGGEPGRTYAATNKIVTAGNRTFEKTIYIQVEVI